MKRGDLVVAAGRPGMGKSTFAGCSARFAAVTGYGVLFISLEMTAKHVTARMLTDHAFSHKDPIVATDVIAGKLTNEQAERIVLAGRDFDQLPLVIDEASSLSVAEIAAKVRSITTAMQRRERALDLVVIDYLKFVKATTRYQGQRHYEIGEITAGLKQIAKEQNVCVLLLAQLNREVEKKSDPADRRPELSHLRESGDIEADADVVMLLFREAHYLAHDPRVSTDPAFEERLQQKQHLLEIIVAKQRFGPERTIDVYCHPACGAVRDHFRGGYQ
jgi:replicative DNA helicase